MAQPAPAQLFVYGTLKRGFGAHHYLTGAPFVRAAKTALGYALLDLGEYPALVEREGFGPVHGELYDVRPVPPSFFEALDAYEDAPSLYRRAAIHLEDGQRALTYLLQDDAIAKAAPVIASGRWDAG